VKDDTLGSDNGAHSGEAYLPLGFQFAAPKSIPLLRWRRLTPYPDSLSLAENVLLLFSAFPYLIKEEFNI